MASLLSAAFPASIQSRIPNFPTISRAVGIQPTISRSDSPTELVSAPSSSSSPSSSPSPPSSRSSRPSTPPTDFVSAFGNSFDSPALDQTPQTASLAINRTGAELASQEAASKQNLPSVRGWGSGRNGSGDSVDLGLILTSAGRPRTAAASAEVNWKYGQNGFRTLESALREASDPDRLPALERQIYIESVAYLLRGLPADLDSGELHRLRLSAPGTLLLDSAPCAISAGDEQRRQQQQQQQQCLAICPQAHADDKLQSRSLPHVVTHWLVTRAYGLVLLLIPVATCLVRLAIDLDRKYHVPEAVFAWAVGVFLVIYKNILDFFVTVCNMADGRIGRAFDDGTAYIASGVASGFREALLEVVQSKI